MAWLFESLWLLVSLFVQLCRSLTLGFSQTPQVGNIGIIANFVFQYIGSFLHYLQYVTLGNVKLDVSGNKRIIFQITDFIGLVHF